MSIHSIYRLSIWLPIIIPAVLIGVAKALRVPLAEIDVLEILAYSLVYGGPAALVVGLVVGALKPFTAAAVIGSVIIIPLGYAYVALAVALRAWLGPQKA